jgi:hypothetical protein
MENIVHRIQQVSPYIKTDDNKVINELHIRWIKKINECLEVCTKSTGCGQYRGDDTHFICKTNSLASYEKLNKLFN